MDIAEGPGENHLLSVARFLPQAPFHFPTLESSTMFFALRQAIRETRQSTQSPTRPQAAPGGSSFYLHSRTDRGALGHGVRLRASPRFRHRSTEAGHE